MYPNLFTTKGEGGGYTKISEKRERGSRQKRASFFFHESLAWQIKRTNTHKSYAPSSKGGSAPRSISLSWGPGGDSREKSFLEKKKPQP